MHFKQNFYTQGLIFIRKGEILQEMEITTIFVIS